MRVFVLAVMTAVVSSAWAQIAPVEKREGTAWYDAGKLVLEGKGWQDTPRVYSRLPVKAEKIASKAVWNLSLDPAGLVVRFATDAKEIKAAWNSGTTFTMNHMAATGSAGLDLYRKEGGEWVYAGTGFPSGAATTATVMRSLKEPKKPGMHEYMLTLPSYRELLTVRIGVAEGSKLQPGAARKAGEKPIVFYGTSITQGGCSSRAGMSHVSILGRWLNREVINLGFSGSGRSELEMGDLVAEIDAAMFVLEPLPNMDTNGVAARLPYWVSKLREKHPSAPIVLVENPIQPSSHPQNVNLQKVYRDAQTSGVKNLHYIKSEPQWRGKEDGTVDGVHPTDLGFLRMAEAYLPVLKQALAAKQ